MVVSGVSPDDRLVEMIELQSLFTLGFVAKSEHPEFRAVQLILHLCSVSFARAAIAHVGVLTVASVNQSL